MSLDGFDEFDEDTEAALKCDIELDIQGHRTPREAAKATAAILRALAASIENGQLDTGHHPVMNLDQEQVGEIYLDFYGVG
ncbi:hypothetical protein HFO99_30555 [Rhizobium leguminosarum]|uniref:hypothetical protein n=1 Tax=Rhizobium leguminosarum TaxID=384 RepID=UPI001C93DCA3|nr:hypothetical protein [Rhizobium leguminosarum]MBY5338198.1 hypothetical protein [Rhizobium leguminosarum]